MNKKTTGIILVLIVLAIALVYVMKYSTKPVVVDNNNGGTPPQMAITYFCTEGTIVASYTTNNIALALSDGRTFSLPQTVTGSGIRYSDGTTTFSSKGSNASLETASGTGYSSCLAGTQTVSGTQNTFTDDTKLFRFSYPNLMTLSGGEIGYTQSWRQQSSDLGLVLAVATVPKSFQPQTNFSEAKFTVGTSSDPKALAGCLTGDASGSTNTSSVVINGNQFTKIAFADAGAGNFYETTSYRTIHNNQCYTIEYTIHSTNIANYPPDQHITVFNKTLVQSTLESVVQSFTFL